MFEDEALVDKHLCNLHVSIDEFRLDVGKFIAFCKRYRFYNILICRVFEFCAEEDHPIDIVADELEDLGMLYSRPAEYYVEIFNTCLYEIVQRNNIY